jgi:electron transport complex protein RnfC
MRYFDVRQSGEMARDAAWPAQPPALRLLDVPTRLQVPLASKPPPAGPVSHLPAGTVVAKGDRLCEFGVAGSAEALTPTSGRIVGSTSVQLLNGQVVPAVDVEADFEDRPAPEGDVHESRTLEGSQSVGPEDLPGWIDRLRGAGVWADRNGSPDLLAQLHHLLRNKIDTILCNLLDDEPTMRLNATLAVRSSPLLMAGVRLLARLTEAREVMLIVEAGSPSRWWSPLRRAVRDEVEQSPPAIKGSLAIVPVLSDYPQSDPVMLLHGLIGRRLRPGRLPVEQRVLVLDAAAAISIGRVATREQPMLQVPLAVRDHLRQQTHYLVAPVGMPLREVLRQCDVPTHADVTLRRGAVLRENEVSGDAIVAGGDLIVHVMPRQLTPTPDPCIRCSWCMESCPTRVQPAGLLEAAQRGDADMAQRYGLDSCIECGVCSYVCPSRLPLLKGIRQMKVAGTLRVP